VAEQQPSFDAAKYKNAQRAQWNQEGAAWIGAFDAMMAHRSPRERESVWNEVQGAMRSFESPDGIEVPGECLVGVATKWSYADRWPSVAADPFGRGFARLHHITRPGSGGERWSPSAIISCRSVLSRPSGVTWRQRANFQVASGGSNLRPSSS